MTKFSRIGATLLLGTSLLAAGNAAPTCNASCIVDVATRGWSCTCQWSAPFGLACAQRPFAVPAGATLVNPPSQSDAEGASPNLIELTAGRFAMVEGQLTFTTTHEFQPGKAYSIPYRLEDHTGTVIQTGALAVAAINVK